MASQIELDSTYMGVAMLHAKLSKARRTKVGACLVTNTGIIIPGVNGLPKPLGNVLEYESNGILVTKQEVIHAEQACLNKSAKKGVACEGATLYVTLSCCPNCSSNMIAAGIKEVVFKDNYRDVSGLNILETAGIFVRKYYEEN